MTRKEAIAVLKSLVAPIIRKDGKSAWHQVTDMAILMAIEALEAEPKHGRNIADGHFSSGYENTSARIFLCSECGYGFDDIYLCNEIDYPIEPNYCPNCGARMMDEVKNGKTDRR